MKQFLKNNLLVVMLWIIAGLTSCSSYLSAGFAMPQSQEDIMNMSEEDLAMLQEQLNQQIEAEIAKMSPEDQEKFFQVMANVEEMAQQDPEMLERFISGTMSKEEEESFVNTMVPEGAPQEAATSTTEKPATDKKSEPKAAQPAINDAHISLEKIMLSLIAKSEAFLVKMQSYPEITIKIRSWSLNNTLPSWPDGKQWTDVERDINLLIQKISALDKEKNSIKKAALMAALTGNQSLVSALTQLNTALAATEKDLNIAPFGIVKIEKTTKKAMQKTLTAFTSALYGSQVNTMLDGILKSYEAEDKKTKEKQDTVAKKARDESAKPRSKEYMKSAGQEKERSSNYSSGRGYSDYGSYGGGGYSSYNPSSYGSSSRSSRGGYDGYDRDGSSRSSSHRGGSTGSQRGSSTGERRDQDMSQGSYAGEREEPVGARGATGSSTTQTASKQQAPAQKTTAPAKREKKDPKKLLVEGFENSLVMFEELVKSTYATPKLTTENQEVQSASPVNFKDFTKLFDLMDDNTIVQASEILMQAGLYLAGESQSTLKTLDDLTAKLGTEPVDMQKKYSTEIKDIFEGYTKMFDEILTNIRVVENQDIQNKPLINRYAFWAADLPMKKEVINPQVTQDEGNELVDRINKRADEIENEKQEVEVPATDEAKKIIELLPARFTLLDLKQTIEAVQKKVASFAPAQVKK